MCSDAFHSQRLQEHASDPERTGIRVLRVRRLGRCWEACHFAARHRLRSYRSARDGRARIGRGRPIDVFRALANGLLQPLRARKRREASRDREARPRHRAPLRRNAVRGRRRRDRRDQARGGHAGGRPRPARRMRFHAPSEQGVARGAVEHPRHRQQLFERVLPGLRIRFGQPEAVAQAHFGHDRVREVSTPAYLDPSVLVRRDGGLARGNSAAVRRKGGNRSPGQPRSQLYRARLRARPASLPCAMGGLGPKGSSCVPCGWRMLPTCSNTRRTPRQAGS